MNKKLDWFKFSATDWLSGSVQLLSDGEKGTFIDLIAMIWKEQGSLTVNNILYRKLRLNNATACERIESYCELGILVIRDGKLSIKFLDKQIKDIETTSKKNSENAKKRWDKKKPECDRMPIREEERREEQIREENKTHQKEDFPEMPETTTRPIPGSVHEFLEIYPKKSQFTPELQSAFAEATHNADGSDVVLASARLYAKYFKESGRQIIFATKAQEWLLAGEWKTDWAAELKKAKSGGTSKPINVIDTQEKDYSGWNK